MNGFLTICYIKTLLASKFTSIDGAHIHNQVGIAFIAWTILKGREEDRNPKLRLAAEAISATLILSSPKFKGPLIKLLKEPPLSDHSCQELIYFHSQ